MPVTLSYRTTLLYLLSKTWPPLLSTRAESTYSCLAASILPSPLTMAGRVGVWHKTSVQTAHEQRHTYSTTTLAGQKRAYSTEEVPLYSRPSVPDRHSAVTRSASLPTGPPRLSASIITYLDADLNNHPSEYSQRKAIQSTPSSTLDPLLSLSHPTYGLSAPLVRNLASLGIKSIYPWQKSCLMAPGLLTGTKNLVYSAPTGGGKSLVADGESRIIFF